MWREKRKTWKKPIIIAMCITLHPGRGIVQHLKGGGEVEVEKVVGVLFR